MERLGTSSRSALVIRGTGTTSVPVHVPAKGDTLHITVDNLPLYDRLISHLRRTQDRRGEERCYSLMVRPLNEYVVEQDYYFVLGDSRHHSADSRYWGFVPADHITGRAGFVLWGKGVDGSRSGRDMTPL
jgi:signal peptidase I